MKKEKRQLRRLSAECDWEWWKWHDINKNNHLRLLSVLSRSLRLSSLLLFSQNPTLRNNFFRFLYDTSRSFFSSRTHISLLFLSFPFSDLNSLIFGNPYNCNRSTKWALETFSTSSLSSSSFPVCICFSFSSRISLFFLFWLGFLEISFKF